MRHIGVVTQKKRRIWPWAFLGIFALMISLLINVVGDGSYLATNKRDIQFRITSESELEPSFYTEIGDVTIDLTDLDKLSHDTSVEVGSDVGNIRVMLPRAVPTVVQCRSNIGDVSCVDRPGAPDQPTLTLTVTNHTGNISVK